MDSNRPDIFDRRRRRALQDRAARRGGHSFIWERLAEDLGERLSVVTRDFESTAIIGPLAAYADRILDGRSTALHRAELGSNGVEEDCLPFEPGGFDLIISAGTLDSVNDLPGALIQIRRALRPDGLFLGHMFGAGTLAAMKSAMLVADGDHVMPHVHPQVDLRSAADLMSRAGFALPVVDQDALEVRYSDWRTLVNDLRDMGVGNALAGPRRHIGRNYPDRLDTLLADGKLVEQFLHIHMSGWAPSPDQPKPARRGSGVSLTQILPEPKNRI